jgi:hypothetical protein
MTTFTLIVTLIAGLAILFLGRQLFWLFVAVVGFAAGFELATNFLGGQPEWVIVLIALLVGVVGALAAIFLRYVAVAVAGFASGAYLGTVILDMLANDSGWMFWILFIAGGAIGAILMLVLFDWALIGLSAVTGAAMLAPLTGWSSSLQLVLFVTLVVIGIIVQAYSWTDDEGNRRVVRRRVVRREVIDST